MNTERAAPERAMPPGTEYIAMYFFPNHEIEVAA